MVLDSRIAKVRDYLGLMTAEDFTNVEPREIVAVPDVGRVTLDHIRIYLAARGLVLKNDRTAEYWQQNLSAAKIGTQIGDPDEGTDKSLVTPFTIIIDSAEQQPFPFLGLHADADEGRRPFIVQTDWRSLGRHPNSLGDYSIDGYIGRCHIERKSMFDLQGTILGFAKDNEGTSRRDRFEQELKNLAAIEAPLVVIEATLETVLKQLSERGKKPKREKAKILWRSILSYQQEYRVPWLFCDNRRLAEIATFRFLERFWRKRQEEKKELGQLSAAI